jgi:nicotinamide riboside kinase
MAKIGLTGTVSVGKTTLVNALKELKQFKDYEIATERSKYLRDQGIALNIDSTLKGQIVFAAERALELMKPNIITDRTIYDVIAFTLSAKSINKFEKRHFFDLMLDLRNEYDVVIYVSPKGVDIENNGVRETNADYRNEIDEIIRELLKTHPPKKLIEISGTNTERINIILRELNLEIQKTSR